MLLDYFTTIDIYLIIDFLALFVVLFMFFKFFKHKNSIRVALIYLGIVLLAVLVNILYYMYGGTRLVIAKTIFDYITVFLMLVFAVVYQSSLKSLITKIARPRTHEQAILGYISNDEELSLAARDIVKAVQNMAKNDIGGIIIIAPTTVPEHIIKSGTELNALISTPLIESIFNKKSPLHDGAVIIKGNRILAAGCFLPLSQEISISKDLGTRHRAAIGITEESDVLAIVVSEETGIISTVINADMKRYVTPEKLLDVIEKAYGISYQPLRNHKIL
ncbi:MAG: diadenylate cyclase [Christensenellales bacterium]